MAAKGGQDGKGKGKDGKGKYGKGKDGKGNDGTYGAVRRPESGGVNREYYRGYYRAKGNGKAALAAYTAQHGPPPSQGGAGYHQPSRW